MKEQISPTMKEWISPVARSDDVLSPMPMGTSDDNPEIIIWSKDHCSFCSRAKRLFDERRLVYEERNLTTGPWTREQLLESVPGAKTLPQIFWNGKHVGGHNELVEFLAGRLKLNN